MNAAALKASGKYYLFMHADSRVDDVNLFSNALQALSAAQLEQSLIAGHFRLRFIRGTSRNAFAYRYAEEKTAFNRVNTTNGDQGLLISREFFELLSGFDESMPFLEVRWPKKSDLRANGLHFRDSSKLRRVDLRPKDSIGVIP
jgi:hypothetical protein